MPRAFAIYPSIYLFPSRRWIYLCISPCPALFFLAIHHIPVSNRILIAFVSHLPPFFFSSPSSVFVSYLTGLWAYLSISRISYSYHSLSSLSPLTCNSSSLPAKLRWMDKAWGLPWLYPMASEWFSCVDSSSLCGSDPVSQVMDFAGVPEWEVSQTPTVPDNVARMWRPLCHCRESVQSTQLLAI